MKKTDTTTIHVGEMLYNFYKDKKIPKTEIGKAMGLEGSTITYHLTRAALRTDMLHRYSMLLKHNLFLDIAAQLPADFTTNAPKTVQELELITRLQEELQAVKEELQVVKDNFKIVKAERDLLKEILGNKV